MHQLILVYELHTTDARAARAVVPIIDVSANPMVLAKKTKESNTKMDSLELKII